MNQEANEGKVCPDCEGTGRNQSRVVRGRITTGATSSDTCTKCGGRGRLYPVKIKLEPAQTKTEAKSG